MRVKLSWRLLLGTAFALLLTRPGLAEPSYEYEVMHVPVVWMPIEVTEARIERTSGSMALGDTIALHEVRAVDAIVLDEPVNESRIKIPAGTVLARVDASLDGKTDTYWCDVAHVQKVFGLSGHPCVSVSDGKATEVSWARSTIQLLGFEKEAQDFFAVAKTPARVHRATPEERPKGVIGYTWCGGDGVATPLRFKVSASLAGAELQSAKTCGQGPGLDSHQGRTRLGPIEIATNPSDGAHMLAFSAKGQVAPGPLARLLPGGAIVPLAEAEQQRTREQAQLQEAGLVPAGPPRWGAGALKAGDAVYTQTIHNRLVGVLHNEVSDDTRHDVLPAGTPMYARALKSIDHSLQLVWCAAHNTDQICLADDSTGYRWIVAGRPMGPLERLTFNINDVHFATPPIVKTGSATPPADVKISYVLGDWVRDTLEIREIWDWGAGPVQIRSQRINKGDDGTVTIGLPGGEIRVRQGPEPFRATVVDQRSFATPPRL